MLDTCKRLLIIALILIFNPFLRVKILQQNGQKQVQHDQIHADVKHWEEEQRRDTFHSVVLVHQKLPLFADEYDED